MEFTYKAYRDLIEKLKQNDYHITDYYNCNDIVNPCILRHDIDISLEKALVFAKLEQELKVQSTFFVLLTSDFYNVFSERSREMIKKIITCGHKIGLHFDETAYAMNDRGGIVGQILYEKKLLESICQREISVVSMHRPSKGLLDTDLEIPGMINSYSRKFFKEFKYVSDSRMRWREDVMKYVQEKTYDKLHILTHASSYHENPHSMGESLSEFIESARMERYNILNQNFTNLSEVLDSHGRPL